MCLHPSGFGDAKGKQHELGSHVALEPIVHPGASIRRRKKLRQLYPHAGLGRGDLLIQFLEDSPTCKRFKEEGCETWRKSSTTLKTQTFWLCEGGGFKPCSMTLQRSAVRC